MKHKTLHGITWLEFDLLAEHPGVVHGCFLRHGGASQGAFDSLNFGSELGDSEVSVSHNLMQMQQCLNLPNVASLRQVHGTEVIHISSPSDGLCGDAMVCSTAEHALMIKHADCQAAIFYDPKVQVIAAAHSGWRGSVQNIYSNVIANLKHLGCQPANLLVCIGPSLGPHHAEFVNFRQELPESFWGYQTKPNLFDFWAISKDQLMACGILSQHIEMAEMCTYENVDDCFSYRRDGLTGRHGTVVMLSKEK
ncbi:MAG: peptidoglycan editing factor PgeF [Chlamydiales bacterium]|nr:peptidoglycan editing factor PgeF [Chlamydiales bacterium]